MKVCSREYYATYHMKSSIFLSALNPDLYNVCVYSPALPRGWAEAGQKGWHMVQVIIKCNPSVNSSVRATIFPSAAHTARCKLQGKSCKDNNLAFLFNPQRAKWDRKQQFTCPPSALFLSDKDKLPAAFNCM